MYAIIAIAVEKSEVVLAETWRLGLPDLARLRNWLSENGRRLKTQIYDKKQPGDEQTNNVQANGEQIKRPQREKTGRKSSMNPYPGVSLMAKCRTRPWRGQVYRKGIIHWFEYFCTPEQARDAVNAKIAEYDLRPIRPHKKYHTKGVT